MPFAISGKWQDTVNYICFFTAGADDSGHQQCFYALLFRGIIAMPYPMTRTVCFIYLLMKYIIVFAQDFIIIKRRESILV